MRGPVQTVVQIVISLFVVALVVPGIVATVGPARDPWIGNGLVIALALVVFVALRLVWPKARRN